LRMKLGIRRFRRQLVFEIVAVLAFDDDRKPGRAWAEGTRLLRNSNSGWADVRELALGSQPCGVGGHIENPAVK